MMALLPKYIVSSSLLVLFITEVLAATVTQNFNISWVNTGTKKANGFPRPVIGINGQWPIPPLYVTKGDNVIINAYNGLGNETTSLHFHGIFMNGTTDMDGAEQVSQCGIPPGHSFTYNFTVILSLPLLGLPADLFY
jgi:iron transport multicopper oxidase